MSNTHSHYTTIFDLKAAGNPKVWHEHTDYPGEIVIEFDVMTGGKSRWKFSGGQAEYLANTILQELQARDKTYEGFNGED